MHRFVPLAAAIAVLAIGAAASPSSAAIVDVPVSFSIVNQDGSRNPCPTDGRRYVVRGHIAGPRAAMAGRRSRAATLYLAGWDGGEWNWRFRAVRGYDYAARMARLGFLSVTIDQLGYGASDHPEGKDNCVGGQADVVHQIVGHLRKGTYSVDGRKRAVRFSKVVLAGHDLGGLVAELEASSFKDVDGLMVFTYQNQGATPYVLGIAANASARCTAGGEPAYPGGPAGYVYYPQLSDWPRLMPNSTAAVIAGAIASRQRNACGLLPSLGESMAWNYAGGQAGVGGLSEIRVPVLLALGASDPVWTHDGFFQEAGWFTGSNDVSAVLLPRTGHFEMLDRRAARFRAMVGEWLHVRNFDGRQAKR